MTTTRRTSVFVAGTVVGAFATASLFGATLAVYKRLIEESADRDWDDLSDYAEDYIAQDHEEAL